MTLAGPRMPHAYDNTQELYSRRYLDILKQSQKPNPGDVTNSAAGDLAEPMVRRSEAGKTRKSSQNSQGNKRQRKNVILPKLVQHLDLKDRSNSVPVMFPPLPANHQDSALQSWNTDKTSKLQSSSFSQEATMTKTGAHVNKDQAKRGLKKMKLPQPPKFAIYRKMGVQNDNFYKAPEKLMDRTTKLDIVDRKRPGHSVTPDKRKAALLKSQALTQNYESANLPRMLQAPGDDPLSVRKKIEQFRKWHEEQYREKLEKLKSDSEKHRGGELKLNGKWNSLNDLRKVESVDNLTGVQIDFAPRDTMGNGLLPYIHIPDDPIKLGRVVNTSTRKTPSPPARVPTELRNRPVSSTTWKTWRGLNESDAYDNVEKYIKENELLSEEKRKHIEDWVKDVEHCSKQKSPDILTQLTGITIPEETPPIS